ncbi:MAG TPA: S9 family peptidase [Planctomycetota bacterium]|nr:S9 family peptidase [Planctomycetota bacterium]
MVAALLAAACLVARPVQVEKPRGWTPAESMNVRTVADVQPSPDGRRVVFTVTTPLMSGEKSEMVTHLWIAEAGGAGARAFTSGEKSSTGPQWMPDGRRIAFLSKRQEHANLWILPSDGGEAEQLTDAKSSISAFLPSPDGAWIAYVQVDPPTEAEEKARKEKTDVHVVDENFKRNRLWVIATAGKKEPRLLTPGELHVEARFDWSPDGKTLVFSHTPTPRADDWTQADLSTVEVATGKVTPLVHTGAAETQPLYSPDGRSVAYVASDLPPTWAGESFVRVVPATGGESRRLADTFDRRPALVGWSADGTRLYLHENRGTLVRFSALPIDGGAPIDLDPGDRLLTFGRMSATRTAVGLVAQDSDHAAEAFTATLSGFSVLQASSVNVDLPPHPLGRTELIHWTSSEGFEIEGLLTTPPGYEKGRRIPLILNVHGGPAGVFTQTFIASRGLYPIAAFAERGYAILRANPRGSSGYGTAFRHANRKDWGGGDFRDLMAGVDLVIARGIADPERLGVMGWSYGGFMTSWAITQTHRFKAASVGAGVTNLMSFNGTADIPSFVPDYFGAESWDNLELYRAHSALFQVKGVTTPTLILHGEADVRVPVSQGYELYNALKRQHVPTQMVTYPRQPHGPNEPKFVLDIGNRLVEWFERYLGPAR